MKAVKAWPSGDAKPAQTEPAQKAQAPVVTVSRALRAIAVKAFTGKPASSQEEEQEHVATTKSLARMESKRDEADDAEVPREQEVRTKLGEGRVLSFRELMAGAEGGKKS